LVNLRERKSNEMSRRQPSRATKSVSFAALSLDVAKEEGPVRRGFDENDDIPQQASKTTRRNESKKGGLSASSASNGVSPRTRGEIKAGQEIAEAFQPEKSWSLKQVVDRFGKTHEIFYVDNGENFNSKGVRLGGP